MNQDSLAVLSDAELKGLADGLFVVADGMGGRAGGEIASRVAVETVPKVVKELLADSNGSATSDTMRAAVHEALLAANEAVFGQARANPELRGMGTTCVTVLVRRGEAVVGNIGDSRVYLLRQGRFRALTHDHSLVAQHLEAGELTEEEARSSRYRNIITRAIGIAEVVEPDIETLQLIPGDTLLLCSDGLTNMLTDSEIARILARGDDPTTTCDHLVSSANAAGGADNITVVVTRYGEFHPVEIQEEDADTQPEEFPTRVSQSTLKRGGFWRYIQIPLLFAVVAAAWLMLSRYELHLEPPYLRVRKVEAPQSSAESPVRAQVDFSNLEYAESPQTYETKGLREGTLDVAPDGTPVVATEDGKILRFGKEATPYPLIKLSGGSRVLAIDPAGNIYVFNPAEKGIAMHSPTGTRKAVIGKGRLSSPSAVTVNARGDVYVLEGGRLMVFRASAKQNPGVGIDGSR
jgi:protein phosphatase